MKKTTTTLLLMCATFAAAAQNHVEAALPGDAETATVDSLHMARNLDQILEWVDADYDTFRPYYNQLQMPVVFMGFRHELPQPEIGMPVLDLKDFPPAGYGNKEMSEVVYEVVDDDIVPVDTLYATDANLAVFTAEPQWLKRRMETNRRLADKAYSFAMVNPDRGLDYVYSLLPVPPVLPDDDHSFEGFLNRQNLPSFAIDHAPMEDAEFVVERKNWLHDFQVSLQFSQAYLSPNWYQGGDNYLALLGNFYWDVQLNQAFHPNLMFQNTISYKLGVNSLQGNEYHKYAISSDLFQWNLRAGFKAWNKWFYSFTSQFKTQMLNNYPKDSNVRTASFMSPGDLNLGLGMTYSTANKQNTFKLNLSIAPISYNLKTCIDNLVDPTQFGIQVGRKTVSQIGSNAELTIDWAICSNISYRSRMFLFTNYKYFLGDWENTFSFNINRFLSTQIYVHLRYDSSSELSPKWKHWMLKEILSFGLSYTFATKR